MEEDDLGRLHDLDDRHLRHILAFEIGDYTPEAQHTLKAIQAERGITDAEIIAYRVQCLENRRRDTQCGNCEARLELDQKDLEAARFTCPECGAELSLSFPLEEYDDDSDADAEDTNNVAEPEESADATPTEEETLAETGESGVACAYCDKELRRDEVCVVDGEFYCTECMSDEKRRVATIEEPTDDREDEIQRFVVSKWSLTPFLVIAVALVIIVMQIVKCVRGSH